MTLKEAKAVSKGIMLDMRSRGLPSYMQRAVICYIVNHQPLSHFLTALFENDLFRTIGRADDTNCKLIREWVRMLYNCDEIPSGCWGSKDRVREWLTEPGTRHEWQNLEESDERADSRWMAKSRE
jgi:hypothetical protein